MNLLVASDDFDDIYKDLFDEVSKWLKKGASIVDFDIFVSTNLDPENKKDNFKHLKISYNIDPEVGAPKLKIKGNLNKKDLENYLKFFKNKEIDYDYESFKDNFEEQEDYFNNYYEQENSKYYYEVEPLAEVNEFDDFTEIILEAPGVEEGAIVLSFSEDGKTLRFTAETEFKRYIKTFKLPFSSSNEKCSLTVNNGIVNLIIRKKDD